MRAPPLWLSISVGAAARAALASAGALRGFDFQVPDTRVYAAAAQQLAEHGRFFSGDLPEIVVTPGYPLLLSLGIKAGLPTILPLIAQVAFAAATIAAVHRLAVLLSSEERAGRWAAILYALDPLSIHHTAVLSSETLFAASLTASLCALLEDKITLSSSLLAASAFIRPIVYYLPLPLATLLIRRPRKAGAFLLLCAVPFALWQHRNFRVAAYPRFAAVQEQNLFTYNGAAVAARTAGRPFLEVRSEFQKEADADPADQPAGPRHVDRGRRGAKLILEHPLVFAEIHAAGVARAVLDPGVVDIAKLFGVYPRTGGLLTGSVDHGLAGAARSLLAKHPVLFLANAVAFALLLGQWALAGFGAAWRRTGAFPAAATLGTAAYLILISGGPAAYSRFRHPVMPIVCAWAGLGLVRLLEKADADETPSLR